MDKDAKGEARQRRTVERWVMAGFLGLLLLRSAFHGGITTFDIALTLFTVAWTEALGIVLAKTHRPRRSFYLAGLISIAIAAIFMGLPAAAGEGIVLGAITWAGVSVMVAVWVCYYEQTEPAA